MRSEELFKSIAIFIERSALEIFLFETLFIILIFPDALLLTEIIVGSAVTFIVTEAIKLLVGQKRPKNATGRRYYNKTFKIERRSFPSAHSSLAMFFAGLMIGNFLFIPLFAFGVFIAYTRIYLKDHYLRDVIAGGLLGLVFGYITPLAFTVIRHVFFIK